MLGARQQAEISWETGSGPPMACWKEHHFGVSQTWVLIPALLLSSFELLPLPPPTALKTRSRMQVVNLGDNPKKHQLGWGNKGRQKRQSELSSS